ncbi:MAG: nicotinamide riboside transporter PnuC [Acidobacteriota bacterium]|nr:nicotinamide riboside transporter PnuC [Acidobacteriota bacterium]
MITSAFSNFLVAHGLEAAGFVTTAVGIWLTTRRSLLCWPVILAADVLYLVVFYQARLLSDAMLQVFFIAFTLYGWWNWWRDVQDEGEVRVAPLPMRNLFIALLAGAIGSVALGAATTRMGAALPYLDAALASYSLVASWWEARRHTANWWAWIVIDVVYVGEYWYKKLWLTGVLYGLLVVLAVIGLRAWMRAQRAHQTAACTTFSSGSPAI